MGLYDAEIDTMASRSQRSLIWSLVWMLAVIVAATIGLVFVSAAPAQTITLPTPIEQPTYLPPGYGVQEASGVPSWIVGSSVKISVKPTQPDPTAGMSGWSGSGTVISKTELYCVIVTCRHVLPNGHAVITVIFPDGKISFAQWISASKTADLALAWIPADQVTAVPIPVEGSVPGAGTTVCQVGYPLGHGPHEEFGKVVGPNGTINSGATTYLFDLHSDHGDSGSGIFDWSNGYLVAVLWGGDKFAPRKTQAMGAGDVVQFVKVAAASYLPPGWDQDCPSGTCQPGNRPPVGGIGNPTIINPPANPPAAPTTPAPTTPVAPVNPPASNMPNTTLLTAGAVVGGVGLPLSLLIMGVRAYVKRSVAAGLAAAATPQGQQAIQGVSSQLLPPLLNTLASKINQASPPSPNDPLAVAMPLIQQLLGVIQAQQSQSLVTLPATTTQVLVPGAPAQATTKYVGVPTQDPQLAALLQAMDKVVQSYPGNLGTVQLIQNIAKQIQSGQLPPAASN